MAKLHVFNFMTLNGFYKGAHEDISWHKHNAGSEEEEFSEQGAQSGGILLFGRVTYEMMAGFWPTEQAKQMMPVVAEGMNKAEKVVFSRTLKSVDWNNSRIISENIVEAVRNMKKDGTKDMTILGSGTIVAQLTEHRLIDSYQFMVDPVAIGEGTPIFSGIDKELHLQLESVKAFKTGALLLNYKSK